MTYDIVGRMKPKPTLNYKSQLEAQVSDWLTNLKIPFVYEINTFKTSVGNYTPDFYLPFIKTYIEVKPNTKEFLSPSYKQLLGRFSFEYKCDLIVIPSEGEILYYEYHLEDIKNNLKEELWEDTEGYVAHCRNCNTTFFTSMIGWYNCRNCKTHNGDHDLINTINENWEIFHNKFGVWKK